MYQGVARSLVRLLGVGGLLLASDPLWAQDATWTGATSEDWSNSANWSPGTVPTGTAIFGASGQTTITNSAAGVSIGTLQFDAGASAYTFDVSGHTFTIDGQGIVNNSVNTQTISTIGTTPSNLFFKNASTAGNATIISGGIVTSSGVTLGLGPEFLDTSSAANATIVTQVGSVVQFRNASTAANATLNNSAGIGFWDTSHAGHAVITNTGQTLTVGGIQVQYQGLTTFQGSASAENATITNNSIGATAFMNTSSAGNATITNNNGGSTSFFDFSSGGNARIINNAGGMLTVSTVSSSGIAIASIEGAGSIALGAKNLTTGSNGLSTEISGQIYGDGGSLTKVGTGTLTMSGLSTYSGGTSLLQGTLVVAAPTYSGGGYVVSAIGSGALSMAAGTTLGFGGADNYTLVNAVNIAGATTFIAPTGTTQTLAGVISDGATPGTLNVNGPGTLLLSGNNTYSGNTNINSGTLAVNGDISSSALTQVNAGTTLAGNGTVGATFVNGGTLAPGNSVGTLSVHGDLTFTSGATYRADVLPAAADRVNVTGQARLDGATVNAVYGGASFASQYTIVNAGGGVNGTFGTLLNANLPSNFSSSLSYDANNVYLNLALNFSIPSGGLSGNQQNVGNALTHAFNTTGSIPAAFGTLNATGLAQAAGETGTGAQQTTFGAMGQFLNILLDPISAGRGDPTGGSSVSSQFTDESESANAYASTGRTRPAAERDAYGMITKAAPRANPFEARWSVWAAGFGGTQTTDGNAGTGSNTATSRLFGTAVGVDYWLSPWTTFGVSLAGGGTNFSVANGGSGRSDLFQAGAFVKHMTGPAYVSAGFAYGWQDVTTDRTIAISGIDRLRARFNANAYSGRIESGYRIPTPWMGLTPYAAGQFTTFELPAYGEQVLSGAGTFALNYNATSVTASRSEIGLRTDRSYALTDAILTLRSRLAWAHDFNPDRRVAATFQALPGASFVVNGAAQARDAALTTASAELRWLNGFSLAATFEGEFSDITQSYAGKGVARYRW